MYTDLEKKRAWSRKYAQKYPERIKASQRKYHQSEKGRMKTRQSQRAWVRKTKVEVLTHYGKGKCACVQCGENRLPALTIDHINGGGYAQRLETGRKGTYFHQWLRKQGYPEGYQTLCMSCQFVKRDMEKEYGGFIKSV